MHIIGTLWHSAGNANKVATIVNGVANSICYNRGELANFSRSGISSGCFGIEEQVH